MTVLEMREALDEVIEMGNGSRELEVLVNVWDGGHLERVEAHPISYVTTSTTDPSKAFIQCL